MILDSFYRSDVVGKEKIPKNVEVGLSQDFCLLRVNTLIQNMVAVLGAAG